MAKPGALQKGVLAALLICRASASAEGGFGLLRRERDHEIPQGLPEDAMQIKEMVARDSDNNIMAIRGSAVPVTITKPEITPVSVVPEQIGVNPGPEVTTQVDAARADQIAAVDPATESGDKETTPPKGDHVPPPSWSQQGLTHAGLYMLPYQPTCNVVIGNKVGSSDHGRDTHVCEACEDGCTIRNMQTPVAAEFQMSPSLRQKPATDIMMLLEFESVNQISAFANNGIYHKMHFDISGGCGTDFRGEMGPQVRGGVGTDDRLDGRHVFSILDVEFPSHTQGGVQPGRFLALPGKTEPGHVGLCRRHCIGCGHDKEVGEGRTTGTLCTAKVGIKNNQQFVFRLFQVAKEREILYDDVSYKGSQWEVRIIDPFQGANYILGTIVTEGTHNAGKAGITGFGSKHEHIGCTPCDAYYQSLRTSGPFVLQPRGQHELKQALEVVHPVDTKTSGCEMNRLVALGGYSLLFESGPGVRINRPNSSHAERVLFKCPMNL